MYQEDQQFTISQQTVPKAVKFIILATVGVFILQSLATDESDGMLRYIFGLSMPNLLRLYIWEPITYMFIHGGLLHIFMNMMVLYFFGCEMENVLGTRRFVKLYFGCGMLAGLGWLLLGLITGKYGVCIGASGAVYGVLGAFAAMYPDKVITLLVFFILPVSMTARTMIIGVGVVSLFYLFFSDGNVAHSAHLAGGIAGYLYGMRIARNPIILDQEIFHDSGGGGVISDIKAKLRRRTMHIVEDNTPDPNEVNRILEKISAEGMGKLTKRERETLDRASDKGKFS